MVRAREADEHTRAPEPFVRACTPEQWMGKASDIRAITTKRSFPRSYKGHLCSGLSAGSQRKSSLYEGPAFKSFAVSSQLEGGSW